MAENENIVSVDLPAVMAVTYSATGEEITFDIAKLPMASIAFVFEYGLRQYGNDGAAIDKHERDDDGKHIVVDGKKVERDSDEITADKVLGVKARIESIMSGVFKTGGGGKSISPVQSELRSLVNTVLRKRGISGIDATKMAKKPIDALLHLAEMRVKADGKGNKDTIAKSALETLTARAEKYVAANKDVDADIGV